MSHTRATRRHHRKRLFHKRLKQNKNAGWGRNDPAWQTLNATKRISTGAQCSCHMCGNPRKYGGNSAHARTWQEVRADLKQQDVE